MKKIIIGTGSVISLCLPALAFAQNIGSGSYFDNLMTQAGQLLQNVLLFLISLAVVWFIWNVVKYSMSSEEDGKEKAKSQMIHGIIALAVIVSLWGIVALLRNAFGVDGNDSVPSNISNMIPGGDSGSSGGSGYDGSGVDNSGGSNDTWNGVGYNNNNTFGDPSTDPSQGGLNTSY